MYAYWFPSITTLVVYENIRVFQIDAPTIPQTLSEYTFVIWATVFSS